MNMAMYVINGMVEFNPLTRSLKNQLTSAVVYLQQPATACLLYLIINQGTVIPQKDLVKEGWKERNVVTMPNTFYQTILTLRKAFEEVGLPRDLVRTISRQGLTLPLTVVIERLELPQAVVPESTSTKGTDTDKILLEKSHENKSYWSTVGISFFFLVSLLNCIVLYQNRLIMPFQNYIPMSGNVGTNGKCQVYYEVTEAATDNYSSLVQKHPEFCINDNYVYLSGYSKIERIVAFVCNKDARYEPDAFCSSHFFWERNQ